MKPENKGKFCSMVLNPTFWSFLTVFKCFKTVCIFVGALKRLWNDQKCSGTVMNTVGNDERHGLCNAMERIVNYVSVSQYWHVHERVFYHELCLGPVWAGLLLKSVTILESVGQRDRNKYPIEYEVASIYVVYWRQVIALYHIISKDLD